MSRQARSTFPLLLLAAVLSGGCRGERGSRGVSIGFSELYAFGPRGPAPTPKLLGLQGRRVTLIGHMVRPEGPGPCPGPCFVGLAGGSPAAESAGAPRSRPRVGGEIPTPERGVEGPREAVWPHGGEQDYGPNA